MINKIYESNDTINGGAYICHDGLIIPASPPQRIVPTNNQQDLLGCSGVLSDRFNDYDYYTA